MDAPHYNPNSVHQRTYNTRANFLHNDQMCRNFWSTGHCVYGDACKFAHVLRNDRSQYVNSGLKSTNDSNKPQRTVCYYFSRGGNCPYDRCIFPHQISEEKRDVARESASISIPTVEARHVVVARNNHQVKTRLCNNWRGDDTCPYGDKCTYAHGRAELRRGTWTAEHRNLRATSKTTKTNDLVSNSAEHPVQKSLLKPKLCPFKWNNRKLVGIYADWINEDSLDIDSPEKQQ